MQYEASILLTIHIHPKYCSIRYDNSPNWIFYYFRSDVERDAWMADLEALINWREVREFCSNVEDNENNHHVPVLLEWRSQVNLFIRNYGKKYVPPCIRLMLNIIERYFDEPETFWSHNNYNDDDGYYDQDS